MANPLTVVVMDEFTEDDVQLAIALENDGDEVVVTFSLGGDPVFSADWSNIGPTIKQLAIDADALRDYTFPT